MIQVELRLTPTYTLKCGVCSKIIVWLVTYLGKRFTTKCSYCKTGNMTIIPNIRIKELTNENF